MLIWNLNFLLQGPRFRAVGRFLWLLSLSRLLVKTICTADLNVRKKSTSCSASLWAASQCVVVLESYRCIKSILLLIKWMNDSISYLIFVINNLWQIWGMFNIDDCKMIQYNRIVRTFWRTRKCSDEVLWRWPKICPRGGTLPLLVVAKYTVCASKLLRIVSFNGKSDFIIFTRTRESRQELRKFMRNIKKSNPERGWVVNSLSLDKIRCFVWNCGCFLCLLFCFLCLLFCFCVYFLFFVSIIFLIGFIILLLVSSIFFFVSIMLLFVSIVLLLCLLFCFLCLLFWFQGNSFALWGHHFQTLAVSVEMF